MFAISSSMTPRTLLAASAAVGALAFACSGAAAAPAASNASAAMVGPADPTQDESIRPFRINIPEAALTDLRRRIAATRWPERETVTDQSQGVQLARMNHASRGAPADPQPGAGTRRLLRRGEDRLRRARGLLQEGVRLCRDDEHPAADARLRALGLARALASFFYDKFAAWTHSGGDPERVLTRDEMLDDITLYWLTNTGTSSSRSYWDAAQGEGGPFNAIDIPAVPVAVTVFPGEIYRAPRSWGERNFHKLIYWNEVDKGGHFAAWEQPRLFAQEVRAAFRSLR